MSAPGGENQGLDKLKALLLGEETRRLGDVETVAQRVDGYVGDKSRLEAATADILVDAFRKAEVTQHKELAGALAPAIITAIQSEIRNSKDMMIEALYPITGRLVTAAVAGAFRDLVESLNQRIDRLVSANVWRLRLRAWTTGRSMAEVALAETDSASLKQALLLERGSGRVIASWPERPNDGDHKELTSGLIAAITEFATAVFADSGGELRMLDLGSSHVFLRASAQVIAAAEFSGALSQARERRLDETFLRIVEAHGKDERAIGANELGEELADALKEEPRKPASKTPLMLLCAAVAALAIWAAIDPVTRMLRERRIDSAFAVALSARQGLAEYPLRLVVDHNAELVILRGLAPNESEPQALLEEVAPAAQPYRVERDVKVVALESDNQRAVAQLQAALTETKSTIDALRAQADGAPAKLQRVIDSFAIFFTEQDALADPVAAGAGLDELAKLLNETGDKLRVVGYADEVGAAGSNRVVSRRRAEKIVAMLVERGVAREKLAAVPRATLVPIADAGVRSRRVVFERPYDGEFAIQ